MPSSIHFRRFGTWLFVLLLFTAFSRSAFPVDLCKAIALKDVPAIENPASMLARGEYDTSITQISRRQIL
jgi:hypothetical protein